MEIRVTTALRVHVNAEPGLIAATSFTGDLLGSYISCASHKHCPVRRLDAVDRELLTAYISLA